MASALYGELAQAAVDLLQELGQPIRVVRPGGSGEYNPDTGTVSEGADQTFNASGAEFDYVQREIDGTNILQGDRRVLVSPDLGTMPKAGDALFLENDTRLEVVRCKPLNPAGVVVLLEVQCRGNTP